MYVYTYLRTYLRMYVGLRRLLIYVCMYVCLPVGYDRYDWVRCKPLVGGSFIKAFNPFQNWIGHWKTRLFINWTKEKFNFKNSSNNQTSAKVFLGLLNFTFTFTRETNCKFRGFPIWGFPLEYAEYGVSFENLSVSVFCNLLGGGVDPVNPRPLNAPMGRPTSWTLQYTEPQVCVCPLHRPIL